jgi:hypothetical protein
MQLQFVEWQGCILQKEISMQTPQKEIKPESNLVFAWNWHHQ